MTARDTEIDTKLPTAAADQLLGGLGLLDCSECPAGQINPVYLVDGNEAFRTLLCSDQRLSHGRDISPDLTRLLGAQGSTTIRKSLDSKTVQRTTLTSDKPGTLSYLISIYPDETRDRHIWLSFTPLPANETEPSGQQGTKPDEFEKLYRKTPALMHSIDGEGKLLEVSDAWLDAFGYQREEVIGKKSSDFLTPESRELAVNVILPRFFEEKECWNTPYKWVRKDGSIFQGDLSAIMRNDDADPMIKTLAVITDVTERNEARDRLQASAEQLSVVNAKLNQFAHVASHDLQEPLRKIKTFSHILIDAIAEGDHEDAELARQVLTSSVDKARNLIRDLLDYARSQNQELTIAPFNITEIINRSVSGLSQLIEEVGAQIKITSADDIISGDPQQIEMLLSNLINNAVKYRRSDQPCLVTIVFEITPDKSWALSVKDNGLGFDPKYDKQIFEPFKRLHPDARQGSGIGLAICKSVCDRHGWDISAVSEPGNGSTFTVTPLPDKQGRQ
ncbi:PAS domain-containing sensor histidine kinase [Coralliovum pocilloporae]|uniref:PAS domain-containing sensor histidine kinase n=1 Tax=Coralliovum pocilloporae TaxID=3066369 RepID=UPI003307B8B2